MRTTSTFRNALIALALVAAVVPAFAGPDRAGTCIVAEIPGDVVLPDGTVAHDGSIRICYLQSFSPVSGLHDVTVDGRPLGRYLSRRAVSEGVAEEGNAIVVLRKLADGTVLLHAYAVRAGDRMVTYRLPASDYVAIPAPDARADREVAEILRDRPEEFTFISALR